MKVTHLALWLLVSSCPFSCGGGKGGSKEPPPPPNDPPVMQVPSGLGGSAPSYTLTLPIAGTQTLNFAATDPDGDPLLWQIGVPAVEAAAAGLVFTSPVAGPSFTLGVNAVLAASAVSVSILVEDPRGAAAAIDLLVVRTGAPSITGVSPASAFAGQPQRVTVTGSALRLGGSATTVVRFDGLVGTGIVLASETTATCSTPAAATAGSTVVSVGNQFGTAALPGSAFTLYQYPPSFFATDQQIDAGTASALQLVGNGAAIHGVWLEGTAVVYRNSADSGATWSSAAMLSGAQTGSEPQVFAEGTGVGVAWVANGTSVWFARSTNGGATFESAVRLDTNSAPNTPTNRPRLCRSGALCHASWLADATSGGKRVILSSSADGGITWSAPAPAADVLLNQGNQSIDCDGALAWVVFEADGQSGAQRGVFAVRTTTGGAPWSAFRRLNSPASAASQATFAVGAGRVHACWVNNDSLYYNASSDNGHSWSPTINVVQSVVNNGPISAPAICCEGDRVWFAYVVSGTKIHVSRYTPLGTSVAHTPVEESLAVSGEPCIRSSGNYLLVAWRDGDVGTGAARIQQAVSGDGGATFPVPAGLGDGTAAQTAPQLLVDGARLLLGWLDSRGATTGVFVNRTQQ